MTDHFAVREEPNASWSVIREETGMPVTLAGVPQTGLDVEDAEALADELQRRADRAERVKAG